MTTSIYVMVQYVPGTVVHNGSKYGLLHTGNGNAMQWGSEKIQIINWSQSSMKRKMATSEAGAIEMCKKKEMGRESHAMASVVGVFDHHDAILIFYSPNVPQQVKAHQQGR